LLPLSPLQLLRSGERVAEGRVRGRGKCGTHSNLEDFHRAERGEGDRRGTPVGARWSKVGSIRAKLAKTEGGGPQSYDQGSDPSARETAILLDLPKKAATMPTKWATMPEKWATMPTNWAPMPEENGIDAGKVGNDADKVGNDADKVGINAGRKWQRCRQSGQRCRQSGYQCRKKMASMPTKSVTMPTKSASMPEENGNDADKISNGADKTGINAGRKWHRCRRERQRSPNHPGPERPSARSLPPLTSRRFTSSEQRVSKGIAAGPGLRLSFRNSRSLRRARSPRARGSGQSSPAARCQLRVHLVCRNGLSATSAAGARWGHTFALRSCRIILGASFGVRVTYSLGHDPPHDICEEWTKRISGAFGIDSARIRG